LTGEFTDEDPAKDESNLGELQQTWLALGHTLKSAELFYEFKNIVNDNLCSIIPSQIFGGAPNPAFIVCRITKFTWHGIAYAVLLGTTIAFQAIDDAFAIATRGPDKEMYSYYYSRATYHSTKQHNEWNVKALGTLRQNMKDQVKQVGCGYFFSDALF
jgi:hypothetical protein